MMQAVLDKKEVLVNRWLKRASVLLSVCTHRTIDVDTLTATMSLFGQSRHNVTWCPVRGDALIDRARSRVASYFLMERKEDILFFVDDDVVFTEKDFLTICDDIVDGRDIVGGMYVQKGTLGKTCVLKDGETITFSSTAKPQEVLAAATGFLAIHRRVFEKMSKSVPLCHSDSIKFHPFFQPFPKKIGGDYKYLSEDWAFCDRARELGFKVWIDQSIFLGHKGEYVYDLHDKARPEKKKLEEITLK